MKNIWKFGIGMLFSISLLVALSRSWTVGNLQIPPLGDFINPFTGFWNLAESGKSGSHENFRTSSIRDSVQIEFDKRMVPYIFSRNTEDAFYAQGHLHARNRLFQMDLTARAIMGNLSEILGSVTLEKDVFSRRINFPLAIKNKIKSWERHPEIIRVMKAYVEGVNDYISSLPAKGYPIEYKLIDAAPELWSLEKTAAISISLAATLNLNLRDFENTNTLLALGPERYHHLFPLFPNNVRPIITQRETYPDSIPSLPAQNHQNFQYIGEDNAPLVPSGTGSNNWAVRAARTRDSAAMLANDPHLTLTLPNIWYELQLHSPSFNAHGVSVPGMPGIVIGFNKKIAWGLTNSALDVLDTYKIKWADREEKIYWLDNEEVKAEERIEIIKIKGRSDHREIIYDTYWGPILYAEDEARSFQQDIAVKWVSSLPDERGDFNFLLGMMEASDLNDYKKALENFYIPGQNVVFASTDDSIAMTVQGKFPIKKPGQGRFILDGSLTSNDWRGFIPDKDLPQIVNPEDEYVLSANEWPTYPDYPYYYSGHFNHYRGRTIATFLENQKSLTVGAMKNIQNSYFNLQAAEFLPVLLSFLTPAEKGQTLIDSLKSWNFDYEPDSPLPTLTEIWFEKCINLTFDEIQKEKGMPMAIPEIWRLQHLLETNPWDQIFDNLETPDQRETGRDIVRMAWAEAISEYYQIPETERIWGKHKGLNINHLLNIPDFSHKNLYSGGNKNTINAITTTHGPSWRMIVELHPDSVSAHVIYPGGQSGNPGSYYYDNFLNDWLLGRYYVAKISDGKGRIDDPLHYTLTFIPR